MLTSNSNIPSFQGIRLFSSKNLDAKENYLSKKNMPLKKTQQIQVRPSKRNIPRSFAAEKRQEHEDEKGTPPMISAKTTRQVRYCSSSSNPSSLTPVLVDATHHRPAVNKPGGKNQDSAGSCVYSILKNRKDRHIVKKFRNGSSRRGNPAASWILVLMMLNILGLVQAMTDCQIMHEWLPEMFSGSGKACCDQSFITCFGASITSMYVA
jgi:hypothetical protein